ncbi:MAG: WD40 repeat domain-containing protein, partial [Nannocystaceae bacterium]
DGFRVLTVSDDHTARVWNAAITNPIRTLRRHQGAVNKIVYSPTGHRLVSGGDERSAFLWDTTSHAVVHELSGHLGPVVDMDFAEGAHDRLVTRAAGDESIRLWEATSGAPVQTVDAHDGPVLSAAFSQGGSRLVTAGSDGQVRTWFSSNGKPTAKPACSLPVTPVRLATLSRHGDYLVVSGHEQEPPQLWNVESCALVMSLDRHQGQLLGVVFANNDETFLTLGSEHTGHLWSTRTGMHEFVYAPNIGRLHTAAFDPDDERILLAGMRATVVYRTLPDRNLLATLKGHAGPVLHAAYSPDGSLIVTAGGDTTAFLWDADTHTKLATLQGHAATVTHAAFAPDRAKLATASLDRTIRLFPTTLPQYLKMACELLLGHTSAYQKVEAYCRDPGL